MFFHQKGNVEPVSTELIEEFINRCCKEKDETLHTLAQACHVHLERGRILSYLELEVLPQVIQHIISKIKKGEK